MSKLKKKEYAGKLENPIRMVLLGDVFCELDKRVKAGKIPGIEVLQTADRECGMQERNLQRVNPFRIPYRPATI
jgi:hypothetical protein